MIGIVILAIDDGLHSVPSPVIDLNGGSLTDLEAVCFPLEGQVRARDASHIHRPSGYAGATPQPQMVRALLRNYGLLKTFYRRIFNIDKFA